MNKTKTNYWVDLIIALAFVVSAISGIVFLLPISGSTVLGVSYSMWDQIHTWGSLLMIAGVLAHLVLHWKWIVAMTKKTFLPQAKPARTTTAAGAASLSRRQFLRTAGIGAVALGAAAVGYKTLLGSEVTADSQAAAAVETTGNGLQTESTSIPLTVVPTATAVPTTGQMMTVACPKGVTYDPYPGQCRHYVDSNGDGYCDYSIPVAS